VEPGDWRTVECWRTAWGAPEVLEAARVWPDLDAAVADAVTVAAFSGRADGPLPPTDVRSAAEEIAGLPADAPVALVFGPETSGLTLREMARCTRRVAIPTHPDQPSLNLSHAVMVAAYEVFRAPLRVERPAPRLATHGEKQAMLALLKEGLRAARALPETNLETYFQGWQALFSRVDLTPKEVRLLEHMARKMSAAWTNSRSRTS
jgi:tRNA/rRNA methyltransferase